MYAFALALILVASAPSAVHAACTAPGHRQFDFWVGAWDVSITGKPQVVAHSLIESLYGGCAVRENWSPLKGAGGGSLSSFDAAKGVWRQAWVDSDGSWAQFEGGWDGAAMVLTGPWPEPGATDRLVRMRYARLADGAVRQIGEQSLDSGKTWEASFDFTYRRSN